MASTPPFKFDKVGIWSELKLEIVEKYGSAYTGAFANQPRLKKYYVDAFSGAGVHISKRSGGQIDGSPRQLLQQREDERSLQPMALAVYRATESVIAENHIRVGERHLHVLGVLPDQSDGRVGVEFFEISGELAGELSEFGHVLR